MKIIGKQPSREKCAESGWFAWDYLLNELEGGSHVHGIVRTDGVPWIRVVTGEMESMLFHMYF